MLGGTVSSGYVASLVPSGLQQRSPVDIRCARMWFSLTGQHASESDVHGQLGSPETRKVLSQDLDSSFNAG